MLTRSQGGSIEFPEAVAQPLQRILSRYPVDSGECKRCARELISILQDAGYDAEILHISDGFNPPAPILLLNDPMPNGSKIIALNFQGHDVVRLKIEDVSFYLDALVYDRVGLTPV